MVKIPTVLGNTLDFPSPGFAEFVLDGQPINLEPVTEPGHEGTLFFILTDVTSQITTYKTARYLHTGLPDHGVDHPGQLTLDFNKLENPPAPTQPMPVALCRPTRTSCRSPLKPASASTRRVDMGGRSNSARTPREEGWCVSTFERARRGTLWVPRRKEQQNERGLVGVGFTGCGKNSFGR